MSDTTKIVITFIVCAFVVLIVGLILIYKDRA